MHSWRKYHAALEAIIFMITGGAVAAAAERDPDVVYVPTPQYVVNEMLEMAGTNGEDVVYDLGCGDGRFVITAAQKYGARGVGVDIDPARIRESQANARSAGVEDKVRFMEADLFKVDISRATVVALYLLPELNLQLRPKLFKELKPGTRIVSHDFDMADWRPDASDELGSDAYFLWILPADVAGRWQLKLSASAGPQQDYALHFIQKFQDLSGQAIAQKTEVDISNFKLKGDKISFFMSRRIGGGLVNMHFKGLIKKDSMSGEVQIEGGSISGPHKWTAVRKR